MVYTPTSWNSTTMLTPILFNNLETQYDEIAAHWVTNPFRTLSSSTMIVFVSTSESTQAVGSIYFNNSTAELKLYISNGTSWMELEAR